MANNSEEVLIEIVVSNEAATKAIFESQQAIERLKQSQKDLTEERKKGNLTDEEYSKKSTAIKVAISQQSEAIRLNEKELKNNIKSQKESADSLAAMRAQLSNNIKAYDNLSKAERESTKGVELQKNISETVEKLKEAEEATGRFQRNVGNYPEAMASGSKGINQITGFLGKMGEQLGATGGMAGTFGGILSKASTTIGGFAAKANEAAESSSILSENISQGGDAVNAIEGFAGKASGSLNDLSKGAKVAGASTSSAFGVITSGAVSMGKAFLAPPIIVVSAIILAIIAAVKLLSDGFKKNDEASTKLSEAFAVFTPILDAVGTLFSELAGFVADLVLGLSKGLATIVDFTAGLFGIKTGLSEAAEEARNLVRAQDDLEEAERNYTINSAKRNVERSKLMAEVTDKSKNDAKTRVAYLKAALELDKANLADEKKIAYERLRIILEIAKNENDTSDETAQKIADARAEAYNAQANYFDGVREINKKLSAANEEIAAEEKKRFEDWKKNKDEQISKEKQYLRQLEDLIIQQIKNDIERQIATEKAKTAREVSDLKEKLKTEQNLTSEARKAINEIIIQSEKALEIKVAELKQKGTDAELQKQFESQQKLISAKIELATKGSDEELNLQIARLELQKSIELKNLNLTHVERLAIINKFDEEETALRNKALTDRVNATNEALNKEFELKVLKLKNLHAEESLILQAELDRELLHNQSLKALDEETKAAMYQSQIEYEIAVAESDRRIAAANEAVIAAQMRNTQNYLNAISQFAGSISALITAVNQDSKESAEFAKVVGMIQIAISSAVAIAHAVEVASKSSTTWYELLAAVGAAIATVASGIAQANTALNASKNAPPVPESNVKKLATGGLVTGKGSGTSDSIDAKLSNGESVLNANSTAMFGGLLSALNVAGGGVQFGTQNTNNQLQGEEMLARAFARGAASLPPPVVSVKEVTKVQGRITVLENIKP